MTLRLESRHSLTPLLYLTGLLLIAEVLIRALDVPEYMFPRPTVVLGELRAKAGIIVYHLGITMTEALLGFVGGNLFAIVFAFCFSQFRSVRSGFYPIVVGMQAVPLVAVAPFILIWFGPGLAGKAVMAALICYFPATVIATDSLTRVNRDALALLRSVGASNWTIFRSLQLPSAIPGILAAFQVSATLCTIGAIVAELAGSSSGVGYLILTASYEFRTSTLFAVLFATSVTAFAFFKGVQLAGHYYGRRFTFSYAAPRE